MSANASAYRWWENYLVRYLMPSIAGAMIVNWLADAAGDRVRTLLLVDTPSGQSLQAPTLVVLFLLGNLFCYVASYPILGFHVTRVIDFGSNRRRVRASNGYAVTGVLAVLVLLATSISTHYKTIPFVLAAAFSLVQCYRMYLGFERVTFDGVDGPVSKAFAYSYSLSRRRGVQEESTTTKQSPTPSATGAGASSSLGSQVEWYKNSTWRREFIDSYRHMREHGNSAFIFVLELVLAGLSYLTLSAYAAEGASHQLAALSVLFAVWAFPAVLTHLLGQHIERRFSWYERRLHPAAGIAQDEP